MQTPTESSTLLYGEAPRKANYRNYMIGALALGLVGVVAVVGAVASTSSGSSSSSSSANAVSSDTARSGGEVEFCLSLAAANSMEAREGYTISAMSAELRSINNEIAKESRSSAEVSAKLCLEYDDYKLCIGASDEVAESSELRSSDAEIFAKMEAEARSKNARDCNEDIAEARESREAGDVSIGGSIELSADGYSIGLEFPIYSSTEATATTDAIAVTRSATARESGGTLSLEICASGSSGDLSSETAARTAGEIVDLSRTAASFEKEAAYKNQNARKLSGEVDLGVSLEICAGVYESGSVEAKICLDMGYTEALSSSTDAELAARAMEGVNRLEAARSGSSSSSRESGGEASLGLNICDSYKSGESGVEICISAGVDLM